MSSSTIRDRETKCLRTMAAARPWVRRVWEEDGGFGSARRWGFAYFVVPSVMGDETRADEYINRVANVFDWGRRAVACGDVLDRRWEYQRLDWPDGVPEARLWAARENVEPAVRMRPVKKWSGAGSDGVGDTAIPAQEEARPGTGDQEEEEEEEGNSVAADQARLEVVQKLRKRFTSFRDEGGLKPGVLPNVFMVVDQDCVDSTIGTMKGVVDWMWLWAVDPEYKSDGHLGADAPSSSLADNDKEGHGQVYRGFLRVRLQQLVNNFYELRRFHDQEYPMERLWQVSRRCRDQLFFSVNEEELEQFALNRDVGSAIRAPGQVLRDQHGAVLQLNKNKGIVGKNNTGNT